MKWLLGETLLPLEFSRRGLRFLWQRLCRGWDDTVLWDLYAQHTAYILPRLRAFRDHHAGYPGSLTDKQWQKILDNIVDAFELIAIRDAWELGNDKGRIEKNEKKIKKGLRLFAKWYLYLWD